MKFSPSLLRKQGLSSSETDVLKPTESGKGRTEPEGQGCEFICRTGVFGWGFKKKFQTKGAIVSFCSPCGMVLPTLVFVLPTPMHSTSSGHGTVLEKGTV